MKDFAKKYLEILTTDLAGLNLTRIEEFDDFYHKQILDSVLPLEKSEIFKNSLEKTGLLVDVGFGGGFPLLPLAYRLPQVKCLGLEARRKKADAVSLIAEKLEIKNASPLHQRLEDVLFDKEAIITLKAVGKVKDFLELINTNVPLKVFFYKGPNFHELEDLSKLNSAWKPIEERQIEIEGVDGRLFIGFETSDVLRGTAAKNKNLVNLTELF